MKSVLDALNEARKKVIKEIEYVKCGDKLYHYTSEAGMQGILGLEGIKIHFSNADGLEDTSEGKEILKCYDAVCYELVTNHIINENFYNKIKGLTPFEKHLSTQLDGMIPVYGSEKSLAYICCLCTDADSPYMWKNYSRIGGYSLTFDDFLFERSKCIIDEGYEIKFNRVFYQDEEKKDILSKFITLVYKYRNRTCFKNIMYFIRDVLDELKYLYKEQEYYQENEIRAFIYLPEDTESFIYKKLPMQHKVKDKRNIKYVSIGCEDKIYFEGITVLPIKNKNYKSPELFNLLSKQRGYNHINKEDIKFSKANI